MVWDNPYIKIMVLHKYVQLLCCTQPITRTMSSAFPQNSVKKTAKNISELPKHLLSMVSLVFAPISKRMDLILHYLKEPVEIFLYSPRIFTDW